MVREEVICVGTGSVFSGMNKSKFNQLVAVSLAIFRMWFNLVEHGVVGCGL